MARFYAVRIMGRIRCIAALGCFGVPMIQAQSSDTLAVTVTATRVATPTEHVAFRVTTLSASVLAESTQLSDALSRHSGAFIRSYGNTGTASASLRGTGATQTLLLLDGFRLSNPQLGLFDLSLMPTHALAGAEVLHGAASGLYGSEAMGGVIQLRTQSEATVRQATARVSIGCFGERNQSIAISGGDARFFFHFSLQNRKNAGKFPFQNPVWFPPRTEIRANNDRNDQSGWLTLGGTHGLHTWRTSTWMAHTSRGLPGPIGSAETGERQTDQQNRFWLTDDVALGKTRLHVGLMYHAGSLRYLHPGLHIDDTGRTHEWQSVAELHTTPTARLQLTSGLRWAKSRATHPALSETAQETRISAYTNATIAWRSLLIYPALSLDGWPMQTENRTEFLPQLGINRAFAKGRHLKWNAGRSFRMPTLNDRFWQPGGNPNLKPENGFSTEAGWVQNCVRHRLEASVFMHFIRDQIVWMPNAQGIWIPQNIEYVRARGGELSATFSPATWRFSSLLTLTQSRNFSDPTSSVYRKQLRYVPITQFKTDVRKTWKAFSISGQLGMTGKRFTTADESQGLPAFVTADVHAAYTFSKPPFSGRLDFSCLNVTQTRYEIMENYPMPPRSFRLQLSLKIHAPRAESNAASE